LVVIRGALCDAVEIMAATIGPIPKMSMSEVPDAATAPSTRRFAARSWTSR
jgi:hypothetical protein